MMRRAGVAAAVMVVGALMIGTSPWSASAAQGDPSPTPVATGTAATPSPSPDASPGPTPSAEQTPDPTATPSGAPTPKATAPRTAAPAPGATVNATAAAAAAPVPSGTRLSTGSDPYAASVRASAALFPGGTSTVILVPGSNPIFAEIAASLATNRGAAILSVQQSAIPSNVLTELRRLAPTSIIVAAPAAFVSDAVLTAARGVTADVRRIAGTTVYDTARLLFAADTTTAATVYIADALTLDDIPLATVRAAAAGTRMLTVNARAALDTPTVAALRAAGATSVVIVESTSRVSSSYAGALTSSGFTVTRITGADRYSLSATISAQVGASRTVSMIVNPARGVDVSLAAYIAAGTRQPLYYAVLECVADGIVTHLNAAGKPLYLIGDTSSLSAAVASKSKCSTVKAQGESSLNSAIRATLAQWPGSYTVTVRQYDGLKQITQVNGGVRREPASMMKIYAAWAAYLLVAQRAATLNTVLPSGVPLGTCIHIMIHVSDNYCHSDIVHWIGIPRINSMIRSAGFSNTYYGSVPKGTSVLYAGNRTTTNDLAYMMELLANRKILSKTFSDLLINEMRGQIWRSRIASGIPPGVPQASKPGSLWVASGLIQNDTALVNGPKSTYILSIMGDGNPPKAALQAISRTVYTHFNGAFGAAATYPVQQMITATPSVLRSSPAGTGVATIPAGVLIEVLDANRVWYEIQYGSRKLWVYYTGLRNR